MAKNELVQQKAKKATIFLAMIYLVTSSEAKNLKPPFVILSEAKNPK